MFDLLCLTDRTLCREPFLDRVAAIAAARPARPDPPGKGPAGGPVPGPGRPGDGPVSEGRGALHPPHLRGGGSGPWGPGHPPPSLCCGRCPPGERAAFPRPGGPPATRWKRPGRRWPWGPPTSPLTMCLLPPARHLPGRGGGVSGPGVRRGPLPGVCHRRGGAENLPRPGSGGGKGGCVRSPS